MRENFREEKNKADDLADRFVKNFDKYTDTPAGQALTKVGPKR
ncbi:hypothetical protein ACEE45_10095 [Proteus vulgaris]